MKGEPKGLPVEPLCQDDALRMAIGEMSANEWLWADTLRRNL